MNPSTRTPVLDVMFHGPLKLFLDPQTGAMVGVQDKATGAAASLLYRPAYIAHAKTQARAAWESRADR